MKIEIERKFLVVDESWRSLFTKSVDLKDGLVATQNGLKVRVRIYENRATITIKTKKIALERIEFEYDIPTDEADEIIKRCCADNVIYKTRHYVEYEGFTWEVDVYGGVLSGIIIAEVELESSNIKPPLPHWVGQEVTENLEFKKINMLRKALDGGNPR